MSAVFMQAQVTVVLQAAGTGLPDFCQAV